MSVWFAIPSARPVAEANVNLAKWRAQGYKIALFCDRDEPEKIHDLRCDWRSLLLNGKPEFESYPGYAKAVNHLVRAVIMLDPEAEWLVTGGDDTEPDLNHTADEIAAQCSDYFRDDSIRTTGMQHETFGVMQPTGDRFAGACIDRICGSPWMGREFCERINGGRGPMWSGEPFSSNPIISFGYKHMFPDEELFEVSKMLGVLWQRRDLIHLHHHFQRESVALNSNAVPKPTPDFLTEANSPEHWKKYGTLFKARKAAGFPGHEPLAIGGLVPAGAGRLVGE